VVVIDGVGVGDPKGFSIYDLRLSIFDGWEFEFDIVSRCGLRISDLLHARAVDVFAPQVVIAVVLGDHVGAVIDVPGAVA